MDNVRNDNELELSRFGEYLLKSCSWKHDCCGAPTGLHEHVGRWSSHPSESNSIASGRASYSVVGLGSHRTRGNISDWLLFCPSLLRRCQKSGFQSVCLGMNSLLPIEVSSLRRHGQTIVACQSG